MKTVTIGFIGLGLIGGSIAKALKKFHGNIDILAFDKDTDTLLKAKQEGIVDIICTQADDRFGTCDYLFLCAPVSNNIQCLTALKEIISPDCIITDVGSVKGDMHRAVEALCLEAQFIGGHPMAGSEKSGYENATDYLLENAYYVLTPTACVSSEKLAAYEKLVASIGALPLILSFDEHDYITAAISHLPHVAASALVNTVKTLDSSQEYMRIIAAGGFKDITRIASSSPTMWQQICLTNGKNITMVLDAYIEALAHARNLIAETDSEGLFGLFSDSREYRNSMPLASHGPLKKSFALYCDIADETGAIAAIAATLAAAQISIKNIGIIHNREFEEGALRIELYQEQDMTKAVELLTKRNYTIYER